MRPALLTLTAIALLLPVAGSAAASSCGAVNGGFENTIRATNVSCGAAKKIVRRWHKKAVDEGKGPYGVKYVGTYACTSRTTDPEHVKVNCANGTKKISFFAGP
jgi:hypothetical protein